MADFENIGQAFVQHYYNTFDTNRQNLAPLYLENSLMTWEGEKIQGRENIMKKFMGFTFKSVKHEVASIDCQPSTGGGILIFVTGHVQLDSDQLRYTQVFHLVSDSGNFFLSNDIFRFNF